MHISKQKLKYFISLKQKKYRESEKLYLAEGEKIVKELLLSRNNVIFLAALPDWIDQNKYFLHKNIKETGEINQEELERLSSLSTPNKVLAVVPIEEKKYVKEEVTNELSIVLDNIQDPGNFGTIIRLADWFGIKNVFCSPDTVDLYNPKTIQATMGAFLRVKVHYKDLLSLFEEFPESSNFKIYGTYLNGNNIYETNLSNKGFIVMGNESKGISPDYQKSILNKLTIPGGSEEKSESLNVSIATAIVCSEFFRRKNI
jgi:RNA methyltransferase, TrmH family